MNKQAEKRKLHINTLQRRLIVLMLTCLLLLGVDGTPMQAQTNSCDPIVAEFSQAVNSCSQINNNYACYGNSVTKALPATERFKKPGDRSPITALNKLTTENPKGAALLRLYATNEEDPITVILFGAAEADPVDKHIFKLRIDNNKYLCEKTPPGLQVRTKGGKVGRITVNGVDIDLASSAFITLLSDTEMAIVNIEGHITVSVPSLSVSRQPGAGQQVGVTLTNVTPVTITVPVSSTIANSTLLQWLANNENGLRKIVDPNTETMPNVPACGGTITYGQTVTATNSTPGQECLYTFNGAAGDIVGIQMATTTGTLNPWVDLRGPEQQLINFNNNVADNDLNSQLCNPGLPVSGQYTIVARSDQNASAGSFKLTLTKKSACPTPTPTRARVVASVCRKVQPGGWIVYQVRPGDTLSAIAQRNRANISQLMQVNCLPSSVIKIGEPLFVPAPPCFKVQPRGWVAYRVSAGDTLSGLAQSRRTSIGQLAQVNCLTSTVIRIGETLFVPALAVTPTPTYTPTYTPTSTPTPTYIPTDTPTYTPPSPSYRVPTATPTPTTAPPVYTPTPTDTPVPVKGTVP